MCACVRACGVVCVCVCVCVCMLIAIITVVVVHVTTDLISCLWPGPGVRVAAA